MRNHNWPLVIACKENVTKQLGECRAQPQLVIIRDPDR